MKNRLRAFAFPAAMILLGLLMFTGTALAAAAVEGVGGGELLDFLRPIADAVLGGEYALASALALVFAVVLARRYGAKVWPFLGTGPGAAILVLLGSFGGALATALTGAGLSWGLVQAALLVAVSAAGGYSLARTLVLKPLLAKWGDKLPSWLRLPIEWVINQPSRVEKAEAAGDAAVKANPAEGASSVVNVHEVD